MKIILLFLVITAGSIRSQQDINKTVQPDKVIIYRTPYFTCANFLTCETIKKLNNVVILVLNKKKDVSKLYNAFFISVQHVSLFDYHQIVPNIRIEFWKGNFLLRKVCLNDVGVMEIENDFFSTEGIVDKLLKEYNIKPSFVGID